MFRREARSHPHHTHGGNPRLRRNRELLSAPVPRSRKPFRFLRQRNPPTLGALRNSAKCHFPTAYPQKDMEIYAALAL
jgi:hypothetical protein